MLWQPTRGILQPNQHWRRPQGNAAQITKFDSGASGTNILLTNSDYTAEVTSNSWYMTLSTTSKSTGKKYGEFRIDGLSDDAISGALWTIAVLNGVSAFDTFHGAAGNTGYVRADNSSFDGGASGSVTFTSGNKPSYTGIIGSILAFAIDFDNGKVWLAHNNTYGGDPVAGTNPVFSWSPAGSWFLSWAGHMGSGAVDPKTTIRTDSTTQTYSPPTGFSTWD